MNNKVVGVLVFFLLSLFGVVNAEESKGKIIDDLTRLRKDVGDIYNSFTKTGITVEEKVNSCNSVENILKKIEERLKTLDSKDDIVKMDIVMINGKITSFRKIMNCSIFQKKEIQVADAERAFGDVLGDSDKKLSGIRGLITKLIERLDILKKREELAGAGAPPEL